MESEREPYGETSKHHIQHSLVSILILSHLNCFEGGDGDMQNTRTFTRFHELCLICALVCARNYILVFLIKCVQEKQEKITNNTHKIVNDYGCGFKQKGQRDGNTWMAATLDGKMITIHTLTLKHFYTYFRWNRDGYVFTIILIVCKRSVFFSFSSDNQITTTTTIKTTNDTTKRDLPWVF